MWRAMERARESKPEKGEGRHLDHCVEGSMYRNIGGHPCPASSEKHEEAFHTRDEGEEEGVRRGQQPS